ncbi:uracil-DNA glycosylase [Desulfogranum japonicum]|uniref:uracil-DNA glycosylase n=1 Tax=Desulfogranum japonicum TaxID=231447 RepID=UPI000688D955|nr:uracil-DNA glycosylase [Desulfogranum japonicum]
MSSDKQTVPSAGKNVQDSEVRARYAALLANDLRSYLCFHQQLGIDTYPAEEGLLRVEKTAQPKVPSRSKPYPQKTTQKISPQQKTVQQSPPTSLSRESVDAVLKDIVACSQCEQAGRRIQPAPGRPGGVKLMIVGDYCLVSSAGQKMLFGEQEDQMLWRMVEALGLRKEEVYVTNCLKCLCDGHPRESKIDMDRCLALLSREIAAVRPPVICAMGTMAGQMLLGTNDSVIRLRGRFLPYRYAEHVNVQVMVTFHPRFLLGQPEMKRATWEDLQQIQRRFLQEKRV